MITLLAPALDALRAQYALTGHMPETEIVQHFREYGKTELQKHRFVFLPGLKTKNPGKFFLRSRYQTDGMYALKKQESAAGHHISPAILLHAGLLPPVQTLLLLQASSGTKMLKWCTGCTQPGSRNSMGNR